VRDDRGQSDTGTPHLWSGPVDKMQKWLLEPFSHGIGLGNAIAIDNTRVSIIIALKKMATSFQECGSRSRIETYLALVGSITELIQHRPGPAVYHSV
jgi:hypothetical protein